MAQPSKLTPEQKQQIVELINKGVCKAEIVRMYGVSNSAIQYIRRKYDIPARETGKGNKEGAWAADFSERWNKAIPKVKKYLRVKGS